jgi:glyoxylate reductase
MRRLLATGEGYTKEQFGRLSALGFDIVHEVEINRESLMDILPTIYAHILGGSERLDAAAIARAVRLRVVSFVGTGYGAFIDEEAARAQGISITSTPGLMVPAVAEHAIGLLLGLARDLFAQNECVKRQGFRRQLTSELSSMAVGIVGMGAIGTHVARVLTSAFGVHVSYTSRTRKPALEGELGLRFFDMDTLLATSDAVLLFVPTSPETENLIDAENLARSRKGLLLVNTAGPRLVNPTALREALESCQVRAAAFDGYWIEPVPEPGSDPFGLLQLPDSRFVVTPHTAAKTFGTWSRMVTQAVENVIEGFERDGNSSP